MTAAPGRGSTAVLEAGDGTPLVLLHGGIECGAAYWAPVIPALAERHRVIAPDVPGLGESEPAARLDAAAFNDWLSELLRETCEDPPTLVAHSLDGSLAARFSSARGDLLRRLVIDAAPGVGPYRMPLGLRVVAIRFGLRPTARNAERFDRWAFFDFDRARNQDPGWFEAFSPYTRARAADPHVKRTRRQLIKAGTKRVPDTELRRIAVPTALLWGRHDRFVPLGLAEGASARLGWPLHVIDDAGHAPTSSGPAHSSMRCRPRLLDVEPASASATRHGSGSEAPPSHGPSTTVAVAAAGYRVPSSGSRPSLIVTIRTDASATPQSCVTSETVWPAACSRTRAEGPIRDSPAQETTAWPTCTRLGPWPISP